MRLPLGPVGGLNAAGPLGGDLGACRYGDRSLGVDLADSRSLYAIWVGGDRSRVIGGERALVSCDTAAARLGWACGDERRDVLVEVLPDERSDSRGGGEGDRRLQFDELGPVGIRSSRRSGLRERGR